MMEPERPHRSGSSSSSELFICFSSRPSSSSASSMKISSKSILSPGHTPKFQEPTLSFSSSRRLRSNGSIKGGRSSPMFPTGNKKRGSAFETSEPSSPKVTCIGQVRVKTKKQGKKMRTRSKRRGEMSFRKTEEIRDGHRSQRWVQIPFTICEALRAFGSEFNCFLPCRSSCSSTSEMKGGKTRTSQTATSTSSCGAVFARWLMALQEGEEAKRRDMGLVVEEEMTRENREVVDVIEIDEKGEGKEEIEVEEEERVSICIPPRNALLLMRCRSEPLRMASLANRFWDSPVPKEDDEDDEYEDEEEDVDDEEDRNDEGQGGEEEDDEEEDEEVNPQLYEEHREDEMCENWVSVEDFGEPQNRQKEENSEMEENPPPPGKAEREGEEEEISVNGSSLEALEELEKREKEVSFEEQESRLEEKTEAEEGRTESSSSSSPPVPVQPEQEEDESESEPEPAGLAEVALEENFEEMSTEEKETPQRPSQEDEILNQEKSKSATEQQQQNQTHGHQQEDEEQVEKSEEERVGPVLPDCLLLMMCEPKLSMEVSKETWVCSTDFVGWSPEKQVIPKHGRDECKKRVSTDSNPAQQQQQPPGDSCSYPAPAAAPSMATMIKQKLVNCAAYEPFVLTRCKSEPVRSSAKLAPEACFWKNRKLEPHRPTTLGVGAAGIGF